MKTKIFATFGPACGTEETLEEMIRAGMTGMRLNLSHTTLPASEAYIRAYQEAAEKVGVKPEILIDMQGPELRVGVMPEPMMLEEGTIVVLGQGGVPVPKQVIEASALGDAILLDDGKILVSVMEVGAEQVWARVLRGGLLRGRKSVKIQDKDVKMPVLTEHDIENIRLANEYGVTALMQPFVLSGEDLAMVRKVLKENGAENVKIFAKIENRTGVKHLDEILPEADVVIIARGDLGNDMPLWELPAVQKQVEHACHEANKPYVVVTQMLASMEEHSVPTRAEVSDIFHAVYCGAYGVMITGETAVGKYPVEAVRYLANTAKSAELYHE